MTDVVSPLDPLHALSIIKQVKITNRLRNLSSAFSYSLNQINYDQKVVLETQNIKEVKPFINKLIKKEEDEL